MKGKRSVFFEKSDMRATQQYFENNGIDIKEILTPPILDLQLTLDL